jgi:hypothetical protein
MKSSNELNNQLINACSEGKTNLVSDLLAKGPKITMRNKNGYNALDVAYRSRHEYNRDIFQKILIYAMYTLNSVGQEKLLEKMKQKNILRFVATEFPSMQKIMIGAILQKEPHFQKEVMKELASSMVENELYDKRSNPTVGDFMTNILGFGPSVVRDLYKSDIIEGYMAFLVDGDESLFKQSVKKSVQSYSSHLDEDEEYANICLAFLVGGNTTLYQRKNSLQQFDAHIKALNAEFHKDYPSDFDWHKTDLIKKLKNAKLIFLLDGNTDKFNNSVCSVIRDKLSILGEQAPWRVAIIYLLEGLKAVFGSIISENRIESFKKSGESDVARLCNDILRTLENLPSAPESEYNAEVVVPVAVPVAKPLKIAPVASVAVPEDEALPVAVAVAVDEGAPVEDDEELAPPGPRV